MMMNELKISDYDYFRKIRIVIIIQFKNFTLLIQTYDE